MELLSARNLAKHDMRRGAYDGANKRRFVLFRNLNNGNESRSEFDTKKARDEAAMRILKKKQ